MAMPIESLRKRHLDAVHEAHPNPKSPKLSNDNNSEFANGIHSYSTNVIPKLKHVFLSVERKKPTVIAMSAEYREKYINNLSSFLDKIYNMPNADSYFSILHFEESRSIPVINITARCSAFNDAYVVIGGKTSSQFHNSIEWYALNISDQNRNAFWPIKRSDNPRHGNSRINGDTLPSMKQLRERYPQHHSDDLHQMRHKLHSSIMEGVMTVQTALTKHKLGDEDIEKTVNALKTDNFRLKERFRIMMFILVHSGFYDAAAMVFRLLAIPDFLHHQDKLILPNPQVLCWPRPPKRPGHGSFASLMRYMYKNPNVPEYFVHKIKKKIGAMAHHKHDDGEVNPQKQPAHPVSRWAHWHAEQPAMGQD
jgi:hypothetical protein